MSARKLYYFKHNIIENLPLGFILIMLFWFWNSAKLFSTLAIVAITYLFYWSMKSKAEIVVTNKDLFLKYFMLFNKKEYFYNLDLIEEIKIYFSYKRGHYTTVYIKERNNVKIVKHVIAMSLKNSEKLFRTLIDLKVNINRIDSYLSNENIKSLP